LSPVVEKRKSTHHSALPIAYKEGFHQRTRLIARSITPAQGETVFAGAAGILPLPGVNGTSVP
jgi:hypothetical protein